MNVANIGSNEFRVRLAAAVLALVGAGPIFAQGLSNSDPLPLFKAVDGRTSSRQPATAPSVAAAHQAVALQAAAMFAMHAGQAATIGTPSGATYALSYERTETGYGGGKVWVGYLTQYGKNYPVLISVYRDRVNGTVATPTGKHRLLGTLTNAVLTDIMAAQEPEFVSSQDDAVPVPEAKAPSVDKRSSAGAAQAAQALTPASAGNPAQIDVLYLYTPGFSSALGGDSGAVARVNLLVATANTVYANSGIYVHLNAVAVTPYNYADNDTVAIDDALTDIEPYSGSNTSVAVEGLRNNAGADLVSLLRQFKSTASTIKTCALAVTPDPTTNTFGMWAHSVVDDVRANGSAACDGGHTSAGDTAPTHEIGHNMGAAHDLYTSSASGVGQGSPDGYPSYNRGYCSGAAGTVMSYSNSPGCSPIVPYFSNPALGVCNGQCGVPIGTAYSVVVNGSTASATGADSTTAINANAPYMSAYRSKAAAGAPVCSLSLVPNAFPAAGGVAAAKANCTNSPTSYTWGNISGVGNVAAINIRFPANTGQDPQTYLISVAAGNANGAGSPAYSIVTVAAASSVNLNQHGLTGSWGRSGVPGTGQGLLINFYPDNIAPGHGTVFAGWYTFDVAGGSGGQRWYALQGDIYSNSSSASLAIYTGADGNLNSGSSPTSSQVGTATLSFSDCSTGMLVYAFNDGRSGSIPLSRVTHSTATCGAGGDTGAAAQNYLLSGAWIVANAVGMGFVIDVSPADRTLLGSWYTYFPAGYSAPSPRQQWFVFQDSNFAPTQTSSSDLDLLHPIGGTFDATVGGGVTSTPAAGKVSLSFTSCTTATLTYAIPTESVSQNTVNLVRLGPAPAGCALP